METTEIKTKVCCHCHVEKPLTEFFNNQNTKDGKAPDCKECRKVYNKAYYAKRNAIVARALAAGEPTSYQVTPPKVNILYKDRQSNDGLIDVIIYQALMNWTIEITDYFFYNYGNTCLPPFQYRQTG